MPETKMQYMNKLTKTELVKKLHARDVVILTLSKKVLVPHITTEDPPNPIDMIIGVWENRNATKAQQCALGDPMHNSYMSKVVALGSCGKSMFSFRGERPDELEKTLPDYWFHLPQPY